MAKEVATIAQDKELVLLTDLNFEILNSSIEKLGECKKLTEKEKEIGVGLLGDWERNVLDKLNTKEREIKAIHSFFECRDSYNEETTFPSMKEKLAQVSDTLKLYNKYLQAGEELDRFRTTEPERPEMNPAKTIADNDLEYGQYELEMTKWIIQKKQAIYKTKTVRNNWIAEMKKSEAIKSLLAGVEAYQYKLVKFRSDCKDKAHLAKINIAISDDKAREAIRELIAFTKAIK